MSTKKNSSQEHITKVLDEVPEYVRVDLQPLLEAVVEGQSKEMMAEVEQRAMKLSKEFAKAASAVEKELNDVE